MGTDPGGVADGVGNEGSSRGGGGDLREALVVAAWTLLFLVAADVMLNRLFPLPRDPRVNVKGQFDVYFNYGWSVEAKIRRAVGPTDETSAPVTLAGWVDREVESAGRPMEPAPGSLLASVYGMSFSHHIATSMAMIDSKVRIRSFGGPSAPANHSYAIYARDRGGRSEVVILGVLASSVKGLATNNGMTWQFEGPSPFTYPRYVIRAGKLEAEWPMVRTLDDLRERLADPAGWDAYVSQLRSTDAFYNDFLFRHDISDDSVLVRMIRRAVAQRWQASRLAQIHGPSGFVMESPVIDSLREIVAAFASTARRDGKLPVIVLIQDQGYSDHLYRAVEPVLDRDRIPFLSTHTVAPATDPRNFVGDGHFTPAADTKIAQALLDVIRQHLSDRKG